MKRTALVTLLSLAMFSMAFAAIDTRPISGMVALTLDVSCFYNEARVPARISVYEINAKGNYIAGTGRSAWYSNGRTSFKLASGKNYRILAEKSESSSTVPARDIKASLDISNFEHSTAIGLTLIKEEPTEIEQLMR